MLKIIFIVEKGDIVDCLNEYVDLIIKKRILEKELRVDIFLKLVAKYNMYYFNKPDCEEAILLEDLIIRLREFEDISEYIGCLKKLYLISSHILYEKDGIFYFASGDDIQKVKIRKIK